MFRAECAMVARSLYIETTSLRNSVLYAVCTVMAMGFRDAGTVLTNKNDVPTEQAEVSV